QLALPSEHRTARLHEAARTPFVGHDLLPITLIATIGYDAGLRCHLRISREPRNRKRKKNPWVSAARFAARRPREGERNPPNGAREYPKTSMCASHLHAQTRFFRSTFANAGILDVSRPPADVSCPRRLGRTRPPPFEAARRAPSPTRRAPPHGPCHR